jgi:HPt (histidine-containing phosphotransfer) domain-containing protein
MPETARANAWLPFPDGSSSRAVTATTANMRNRRHVSQPAVALVDALIALPSTNYYGRVGLDGAECNSVDDPARPLVDQAVVKILLDELGVERAQEICGVFVRDGRERVRAMESALDRGDAVALAQAAHALKSGSGFVGATGIYARCAAIERTAGAGGLDEARRDTSQLRDGLERAAREFVRIVGPGAAPS